jgi:hypothetical protein
MPEPIAWQIESNLKAALDNIDGTGDYFYNIALDYVEYDQTTFNALDAEIESVSLERNDARTHQGKTDWDQTFDIRIALPVGTGITGEHDQRLHRAFADVARAVMADPRRGELAHDTAVLGYEPSEKGSARLSCTVSVQVSYRTDELDLTSK